jgi:hypothetical protein
MAGDIGDLLGTPKKKGKSSLARQLADTTPDPLEGVEYTGDFAEDSQLELDAVHAAFRDRAAREQDRLTHAMDSQYWLCLCFKDSAAVLTFLRAAGLERLGDKYLDGHEVAQVLGVDMTGEVALRKQRSRSGNTRR